VTCQPFSVAGNRQGKDDERYLLPEMLRIIDEVQPYAVLFENVPGFPSLNDGAEFKYLLGTLAEMGFDAEWGIVGADDLGALHRRERIWIVASDPKRVPKREESRCWTIGRMGREFESLAQDRNWKDKLASFRGMANGLARAVDRTNCIRNGQVPAVAATAWRILSQ